MVSLQEFDIVKKRAVNKELTNIGLNSKFLAFFPKVSITYIIFLNLEYHLRVSSSDYNTGLPKLSLKKMSFSLPSP
jgi:hypothetical protein